MSTLKNITLELNNLSEQLKSISSKELDLYLVLDYGVGSEVSLDLDLKSKKTGVSGGYSFKKLSYSVNYKTFVNYLEEILGRPYSTPERWHSETVWILSVEDFNSRIKKAVAKIS